MRTHAILILTTAGLALGSCKNVDCGTGTIEQGGACVPANETVTSAQCGPFTVLTGNVCTPMFDPTQCDPTTTTPDLDPTTGVTTCVGNGGGGGCGSTFACPAPSAGKQTICGQIYDIESGDAFQSASPVGASCGATPAASGPCALGILAYDAVSFAENPSGTSPLANGGVFIDDCGRFRVSNITPPSGPFLALAFDDASPALIGPPGVTNGVGIATARAPDTAVKDFEGYIATKATTDMWASSGGPPISNGIYMEMFRAHMTGFDEQAGVEATKDHNPNTANSFYFSPSETKRDTIDPTATATGVNGTALVQGATVTDLNGQGGQGGIDSTCIYANQTGAALPNILFIQIFRPTDASGMTCDL